MPNRGPEVAATPLEVWRASRALRDACRRIKVPAAQVAILQALGAANRPLALHEVAEAAAIAAPTASRTVEELLAGELVTRRPHPTSRRVQLVEITPLGVARTNELVAEIEAVLVDDVSRRTPEAV